MVGSDGGLELRNSKSLSSSFFFCDESGLAERVVDDDDETCWSGFLLNVVCWVFKTAPTKKKNISKSKLKCCVFNQKV